MKKFLIQPYDYRGDPLPLQEVEAKNEEDARAFVEDLYGKIFGGGSPIKMDLID